MNSDPNTPQQKNPETPQPVAYDAQGRPLYAHPPMNPTPAEPAQTVVHVARPLEPDHPVVSDEVQQKHDRSKQHYPFLNLSIGEYVIRAVRRHPIGLIIPLTIGTLLIAAALTLLVGYEELSVALVMTGPLSEASFVAVPILVFVALVAFSMFVSYYVYVNNKFFLTNESVIQEIQHTLFSRLEQTVSLANIEDASFTQHGILQQILDYGDIRLSTEGDETTYRFTYVAHPKEHIARLNNAVEAFKNGRPVSED